MTPLGNSFDVSGGTLGKVFFEGKFNLNGLQRGRKVETRKVWKDIFMLDILWSKRHYQNNQAQCKLIINDNVLYMIEEWGSLHKTRNKRYTSTNRYGMWNQDNMWVLQTIHYICNPIMLQKYEWTFISVMNFYSSTDYQQYDKTGPVVTNGKVGMSTIWLMMRPVIANDRKVGFCIYSFLFNNMIRPVIGKFGIGWDQIIWACQHQMPPFAFLPHLHNSLLSSSPN